MRFALRRDCARRRALDKINQCSDPGWGCRFRKCIAAEGEPSLHSRRARLQHSFWAKPRVLKFSRVAILALIRRNSIVASQEPDADDWSADAIEPAAAWKRAGDIYRSDIQKRTHTHTHFCESCGLFVLFGDVHLRHLEKSMQISGMAGMEMLMVLLLRMMDAKQLGLETA